MNTTKAMTVRLSNDLADDLEAVAQAAGIPVSDVIRRAIAEHINARRRDPEFQQRLRDLQDRMQATVNRLQPSLPERLDDYRSKRRAYQEQIR